MPVGKGSIERAVKAQSVISGTDPQVLEMVAESREKQKKKKADTKEADTKERRNFVKLGDDMPEYLL